jgi:multiple sugar transport system substrate-binding protein
MESKKITTRTTRRTALGAAGLSLLLLAGCGSADASSTDSASAMYTWISNENDREQWEAFITAAQQENPDFALTLEGPSFTDYWTKVKTRMSAGDAPCIITTQAARAQELSSILMPLDDLAAEHGVDLSAYNESMIQGLTVDGTIRAIPYDAEPMVLYYNKDLFAAAGLEEPGLDYTTDQFIADAKALTGDGVHGFATPPQLSAGPGLAFAFSQGAAPVQDGEYTLTDPAFVEAMQWTFDLVAEHGVASAPQSADPSDVHLQEFMAGNAAMIVDGPWQYEGLTTGSAGEVGIAVIPSPTGEPTAMIQGSGFGISESCEDPAAAFEKIAAITTPEVVGQVGAERGTVPSIPSAVGDWAADKPEQDVVVIEELLASGRPLETTPDWNQVETVFTQYSGDGFRGTRSAEDILTTIESSIR